MSIQGDGIDSAEIHSVILEDDGKFPNNQELPLLVYKEVFDRADSNQASRFEQSFQTNHWDGCWRNGIYSFHHYHSTAHEVLGVASGTVDIKLGGEDGRTFNLKTGDAVVLPAGTAHKNLGASGNFQVVGAYPEGQDWDMNYGEPSERPRADRKIADVPLPKADPLYGEDGPLVKQWVRGK